MKPIINYKQTHDYSNIKTLEELRLARVELKGEIREKERDIHESFDSVVYMLNPGRIIASISSNLDIVGSIIVGIKRGYRYIRELINGEEEKTEN